MAKREEDSWGNAFIGPILVFLSLCALWKNETRFDYYRAASKIEVSTSLSDVQSGQPLAYTGIMDPGAVSFQGNYIEQFTGFLVVYREAEIYAWDRDEDSDGDVTWSREWMSSVESNSRNNGIRQELASRSFLPSEYEISDLAVASDRIEFVDSTLVIPPNNLRRTIAGSRLSPEGRYFVLRKGRPDNLGDERLLFRAIPVPKTATYFGKFENGKGVADRSHERTNFINEFIQDTGILHHIVAGEREQALATMKAYLTRLKWIVRGIGTALVVFGFSMAFSKLVGFLFHIPLIGALAEAGVFVMSVGLGIPLALLTIGAGYLAGHPIILGLFLCLLAVGIFFLVKTSRRGRESQMAIREELEHEFGHQVDSDEMKEREFVGLAHLVNSGNHAGTGNGSSQLLDDWSKKHRWDADKKRDMLAKAEAVEKTSSDQELRNLIRIALADRKLTAFEMRSIQTAASKAGYGRNQVRKIMGNLRRSAQLG